MKSKTNIFLVISAAIAIALTGWIYYQMSHKVGELSSNKETDGNFKVCNEDKIPNYYGMDTDFVGGKKAIKNKLLGNLQNLKFENSGLITFRFIVNCEGDIGRFRTQSTNLRLEKVEVELGKLKSIEKALSNLKDWNPAKTKFNSYDSYYVLNFKIRKNRIVDIF
ncbi:hypothetical protein [uncultured Christiangramia sp.]|uniref:hypothetical protein n=1 Tax=uncultured Christiangramia sp. TaxID=503836 RepID=UPI0026372986|nr:hypothetical protein [uncultured Christiangramia sp.]